MKKENRYAAQVAPDLTVGFEPATQKPVWLRANRKVVLVCDFKTRTYTVESYWWFKLKNWLLKLSPKQEGGKE